MTGLERSLSKGRYQSQQACYTRLERDLQCEHGTLLRYIEDHFTVTMAS